MKNTITLAFAAMTLSAQAALTLTNTDFEGGISTGNTPTGWTEIAASHFRVRCFFMMIAL